MKTEKKTRDRNNTFVATADSNDNDAVLRKKQCRVDLTFDHLPADSRYIVRNWPLQGNVTEDFRPRHFDFQPNKMQVFWRHI